MSSAEKDSPATATASLANDLRGFSLCEGGPLYRIARSLGLPGGRAGLVRLGLAITLLTWLPPAVMSAIGKILLTGSELPFFSSVGTHVRLLVAIPLFFVAEVLFDRRAGESLRRMFEAQIVAPGNQPAFARALRSTMRWRNSWVPEVVLLVLAFVLISSGVRTDLPENLQTWRTMPDGRNTMAGWWYAIVSLPAFQFLMGRWCWRLLLWWVLLWRIARFDLQLMPTHPDRAGGLGMLGVVHLDLAPLGAAGGAVLAANFAPLLMLGSARLEAFAVPAVAYVALMTLTLIAPLFFFTPRLLEVKQRGLMLYGALAADYTIAFDRKWLRKDARPDESILGTADLQSLADLANSFGVIQSMRLIPMTLNQLVRLVAAAALPMAPLLLYVFSLDELIIRIGRAILQI